MTIHLPKDVENSINAEVLLGHFASVDDALAEAWRNFQCQKPQAQQPTGQGSIGAMRDASGELDEAMEYARKLRQQPLPASGDSEHDPVLGSMREDADLLDEIVEQAMRNRREQPWRLPSGE